MERSKTQWVRVTRGAPCPVCESDSWCGVSADGRVVHCMRVESNRAVPKGGWIHKMNEPIVVQAPRLETRKRKTAFDWDKRSSTLFKAKAADRLRRELTETLGVSLESLVALEVGAGFDHAGAYTSWPARDVRWIPVGIVRRYADGTKKTDWGGSSDGLFFEQHWWRKRGPIFLPEGGSDVAALLTMGLCAIGRPSNVGGIEKLIGLLSGQKNRPVIVLGEDDEKPAKRGQEKTKKSCPRSCKGCRLCWPGMIGAKLTAERLEAALNREVSWRVVRGAKDAREWLKQHGVEPNAFVESLDGPRLWLRSL